MDLLDELPDGQTPFPYDGDDNDEPLSNNNKRKTPSGKEVQRKKVDYEKGAPGEKRTVECAVPACDEGVPTQNGPDGLPKKIRCDWHVELKMKQNTDDYLKKVENKPKALVELHDKLKEKLVASKAKLAGNTIASLLELVSTLEKLELSVGAHKNALDGVFKDELARIENIVSAGLARIQTEKNGKIAIFAELVDSQKVWDAAKEEFDNAISNENFDALPILGPKMKLAKEAVENSNTKFLEISLACAKHEEVRNQLYENKNLGIAAATAKNDARKKKMAELEQI